MHFKNIIFFCFGLASLGLVALTFWLGRLSVLRSGRTPAPVRPVPDLPPVHKVTGTLTDVRTETGNMRIHFDSPTDSGFMHLTALAQLRLLSREKQLHNHGKRRFELGTALSIRLDAAMAGLSIAQRLRHGLEAMHPPEEARAHMDPLFNELENAFDPGRVLEELYRLAIQHEGASYKYFVQVSIQETPRGRFIADIEFDDLGTFTTAPPAAAS